MPYHPVFCGVDSRLLFQEQTRRAAIQPAEPDDAHIAGSYPFVVMPTRGVGHIDQLILGGRLNSAAG